MKTQAQLEILDGMVRFSLMPVLFWMFILSASCVLGLSPFFSIDAYTSSLRTAWLGMLTGLGHWMWLTGFLLIGLGMVTFTPRLSAIVASFGFLIPLLNLHVAGIAHVKADTIWAASFVVLSTVVVVLAAYCLGANLVRIRPALMAPKVRPLPSSHP